MSGPTGVTPGQAKAVWNALPREPDPASQAALAVVAAAVRVKLARGGWGRGVDGMVIRLSKEHGEALLAELDERREGAN